MKADTDNETHVEKVSEETDKKETVVIPSSVKRRERQGYSGRYLLDSAATTVSCLTCRCHSQGQSKHEAALDHAVVVVPFLMPYFPSHVWTSLAYRWPE
jgi:hypothetical protein